MPEFNQDLNALIDARFPILVSETHEESRLLTRVREICMARDIPLFVWSLADGLKRSTETSAVYNTTEFTDALKHVDATPQNGLYVFLDAGLKRGRPKFPARRSFFLDRSETFRL